MLSVTLTRREFTATYLVFEIFRTPSVSLAKRISIFIKAMCCHALWSADHVCCQQFNFKGVFNLCKRQSGMIGFPSSSAIPIFWRHYGYARINAAWEWETAYIASVTARPAIMISAFSAARDKRVDTHHRDNPLGTLD